MPNRLKKLGADGIALQVTESARSAGLVKEDNEGEVTYMAAVRVYNFNNLLLVIDREKMDVQAVAQLVAATAEDTKSIYQGIDASIQSADNGYKVQLPYADEAGFAVGDLAPVYPASNMLVITTDDPTATRLAKDVVAIRHEQVE